MRCTHLLYSFYVRLASTRRGHTLHASVMLLVHLWHEGVAPGLLPEDRHVSRDGVQVDMFLFGLSSAASHARRLAPPGGPTDGGGLASRVPVDNALASHVSVPSALRQRIDHTSHHIAHFGVYS